MRSKSVENKDFRESERGLNDEKRRKIRAAFLISELAPGGAEKALFQLMESLDLNRFEPVVYTLFSRPSDLKNSLIPLFRKLGVETIELGMKRATDLPRVFCRLRRLLRAQKPDFLQSFLFHSNFLGRFAARAAGVPLVCAGVRVAERDSPFRLKLDYWTRNLCDAWICVGESVAEFTRTSGRVPAEKVFSIPNGIRLNVDLSTVFAPADVLRDAESNLSADEEKRLTNVSFGRRKRILCVGRLTRQKGFDQFLENAPNWLTPKVAQNWEIWIVGDGEEKAALSQLIENKGLKNEVFLSGWRSDVPLLLATSEIFALPSRWEGMPNALLEAAAAGKPVLCSNVEGVAEILGDAFAPQSCEFGDSDAWTQKMIALIDDEKYRRELGRRNRERVLSEFTVEKSTRKYEKLWLRLLKNKGIVPQIENF